MKIITCCTGLVFTVISLPVSAVEWSLVPGISYQQKYLDFEQVYFTANSSAEPNKADFSTDLPVLTASLTLAVGKFFISTSYGNTIAASTTSTSETDRSREGEIQPNLIAVDGSDVDVERRDVSVTVGANIFAGLTGFIGYLDGRTRLSPDPFCATPASNPNCQITNRAFLQYFSGKLDEGIHQPSYQQEYSESGPFIGAGYAWNFDSFGTLSASLAYAFMDGKYRDNANDPNGDWLNSQSSDNSSIMLPFNYQGDSTGLSLGLTWVGNLGDSTNYTIDIRQQQYEMDATDVTGADFFSNVQLETKETMFGVSLGVQYYF